MTAGSTPSSTARCITASTTRADRPTPRACTARRAPAPDGTCTASPTATSTASSRPMGSVPESNIRDTLTANGWRIDFLGPTTYLGNSAGFGSGEEDFPQVMAEQLPPEALEQMREVTGPVQRHRGPARRRPGLSAVHRRARAPGGLSGRPHSAPAAPGETKFTPQRAATCRGNDRLIVRKHATANTGDMSEPDWVVGSVCSSASTVIRQLASVSRARMASTNR